MARSKIFDSQKTRKSLEEKIKNFLNKQSDFLSLKTINSPRAAGDAIEKIISENFSKIIGNLAIEYFPSFERRDMADLAFIGKDGHYYAVDVKTHRIDTKFNMPNLTSVERLTRFYREEKNYFLILKIDYKITGSHVRIQDVTLAPIELFDWNFLTIGSLGWGQIQIRNANYIKILPENSRSDWMIELCHRLLDFYPKEIKKIEKRNNYFKQALKDWQK